MSTAVHGPISLPSGGSAEAARERANIWSMIQQDQTSHPPPYVHPLLRRSSSFLSQKSLEVCTESLGSETGSDGYSDPDSCLLPGSESRDPDHLPSREPSVEAQDPRRVLPAVNYRRSATCRRSPARSFPPPLPSISRRDGPCFSMRAHRLDGRLVVHAVAVPSQNYLHCHREGGRLLLSFVETAFEEIYPGVVSTEEAPEPETREGEEDGESEEEEDVVRTASSWRGRSSSNDRKDGGGAIDDGGSCEEAAAGDGWRPAPAPAGRQELLHHARCNESQMMPLFAWEPLCIATS